MIQPLIQGGKIPNNSLILPLRILHNLYSQLLKPPLDFITLTGQEFPA